MEKRTRKRVKIEVRILLVLLIFSFACQKDDNISCSDGQVGRVCREDFFIGNSLFRSTSYQYFNDNYYVKIIKNGKGNKIGKETLSFEDGLVVKRVVMDHNGTTTLTQNIQYDNGSIVEIKGETRSVTINENWTYVNHLLVKKELYKSDLLVKKEEIEYSLDDTVRLRTLFFFFDFFEKNRISSCVIIF